MAPSTTVKVYRDLFRAALKAIHYSTPARYKVRDILREAFRNEPASSLNPRRVANTMRFLRRAQKYNGYEHKILKNLLFIRYWRENMHHSKLYVCVRLGFGVGVRLQRERLMTTVIGLPLTLHWRQMYVRTRGRSIMRRWRC